MKEKALCIRQPKATLLALGYHRHHARRWPVTYRGPVLLFANYATSEQEMTPRTKLRGSPTRFLETKLGANWDRCLAFGAFIGRAQLVGCLHATKTPFDAEDLLAEAFDLTSYAFEFAEPELFPEPIFGKGNPGLFDAEIDLHTHV